MKPRVPAQWIPLSATFLVMLALIVIGGFRYTGFATASNIFTTINDNSYTAVAAVGATLVILSGGIDLSVGSLMAFSATLLASLVQVHHINPYLAMMIVVIAGACSGLITGGLICAFDLPPFMVTLAGMYLLRSFAFAVSPEAIDIKNTQILNLSMGGILMPGFRIHILTLVLVVIYPAMMIVNHFTRFGRNIYAIGGSAQSAGLMGVPLVRTKVLIYTIAGICSAAAGIMFAVYKSNGDPSSCVGSELDAIAAVVIGGTMLTGGEGYVIGTLLGVMISGLIQSIIYNEGTNPAWTRISSGLLLLIFVLLQQVLVRLGWRRRSVPIAGNPI
jgi:galactofuranose transport system permease protein